MPAIPEDMSQPEPTAVRDSAEVTLLLQKVADGEPQARASLIDLLYPELKQMAKRRMATERANHTLQPTALVNEFFMEIARSEKTSWRNRTHFLAAASQAMRRFLIDHARSQNALRRGGGRSQVELPDLGSEQGTLDAVIFEDLLGKLAALDARMAQVVELRLFGGLTYQEISEVLGIDERTARRDWDIARAWLRAQLARQGTP